MKTRTKHRPYQSAFGFRDLVPESATVISAVAVRWPDPKGIRGSRQGVIEGRFRREAGGWGSSAYVRRTLLDGGLTNRYGVKVVPSWSDR